MGFVVSLRDFRPGVRYDGTPWTQALIEEAADVDGPFALIDTQPLVPVDADPANPQSRNFTTDEATLPSGWYRVTFRDVAGATQRSDAVYFPGAGAGANVPHGFSLERAKTYITTSRNTQDEYIAGVLRGTHGFARGHLRRRLVPSPLEAADGPVTERVIAQGSRFVRVPDVREIAAIRVDDRVVTDYEVLRLPHEESSPIVRLELYTRGGAVEVDGWFGFDFTDTGEDVHELADAIYAHAARVFHERTAMYADIISSAEYGTQTYLRSLPPRVRDVYELYRVPSDWFGIS